MASPVCSTRTARASTARRATAAGCADRVDPGGPAASCANDQDCAEGLDPRFPSDTCETSSAPSPGDAAAGAPCTSTSGCNLGAGLVCAYVRHVRAPRVCAGRSELYVRRHVGRVTDRVRPSTADRSTSTRDLRRENAMCVGGACQQGPAEGDPWRERRMRRFLHPFLCRGHVHERPIRRRPMRGRSVASESLRSTRSSARRLRAHSAVRAYEINAAATLPLPLSRVRRA